MRLGKDSCRYSRRRRWAPAAAGGSVRRRARAARPAQRAAGRAARPARRLQAAVAALRGVGISTATASEAVSARGPRAAGIRARCGAVTGAGRRAAGVGDGCGGGDGLRWRHLRGSGAGPGGARPEAAPSQRLGGARPGPATVRQRCRPGGGIGDSARAARGRGSATEAARGRNRRRRGSGAVLEREAAAVTTPAPRPPRWAARRRCAGGAGAAGLPNPTRSECRIARYTGGGFLSEKPRWCQYGYASFVALAVSSSATCAGVKFQPMAPRF